MQYVIEADGTYLGGWSDADAAQAVVDAGIGRQIIGTAPDNANQKWDGAAWSNPLGVIQTARRAEVDAMYLAKLSGGATLPGVSAPVQIDDASRANVIGAALQASIIKGNGTITATWPGTYTWRLADNTAYSIPSAPAMILFAIKVAGAYLALRTVAWGHKDAINALTDPNAVAAYDITVNWPS